MQMKQWGTRLALTFVFCVSALGCHLTDTFLAQATLTATRTRTVKPTFTIVPSPTMTPLPPTPPPPTLPPTPTRRPTARPVPTRTPTKPAPPPAPTSPPVVQKQYGTANVGCVHAGNQYVKGRVYDSISSSANGVGGMNVWLGGSNGTDAWVKITTGDDGFYTFTLSVEGGAQKQKGDYYVWLVDGSGNRISDMGGPITINPLAPDQTGDCWAGTVDFYRR